MKKRKWVYILKPTAYEMSCDLCNGNNITWSEYENMIWCYDCEKDTPGNGGIFSSPIPIQLAKMFGLSFDRIDLKTKEILYMKVGKKRLYWTRNPNEKKAELPNGNITDKNNK